MPSTPSLPGYAASVRGYSSRCLHHWRAADASLLALDGTVGALLRSGTATGTDVNGATVTYRDQQPAWTLLDTDADSIRDTLYLSLSSTLGQLSHVRNPRQTIALTLYAKFIDRRPGSNTGFIVLLSQASSTYDFGIRYNGTTAYQAHASNGTPQTSTSGAVGGVGSVMECLATLTTGGVTQLTTSVAGAAGVTATASSASARPGSSTSGTLYAAPSSAGAAACDLLVVKLGFGLRTLDEMRELG